VTDCDLVEKVVLFGRMAIALDELEQCQDLVPLMPEIRTNCVFARLHAQDPRDVAGVDGRIMVVNGMPVAAGKIRLGASGHLARFVVELMKTDPKIRSAINFANFPTITRWLEDYCDSVGWRLARIDRNDEPAESQQAEGSSMAWKARAAVRAAGGYVPKIICDAGGTGKEPVCIIVGKEPVRTARELCGIAHAWAGREITDSRSENRRKKRKNAGENHGTR